MTTSTDTKLKRRQEEASGRVIKLSRIPYGFFEEEILQFFTQFGRVERVRIPRSKKGNFKELAYVYFSEPEVAKLASDSMNNYLMFDRRVRSSVLTEKIPPTILSGPRLIRTAPLPDRDKKMQAKQMCAKKDERGVIAFKKKLATSIDKSMERLKKAGYKYKFDYRKKM